MRSRDPSSRNDRYMLVTLDEPIYSIKVRVHTKERSENSVLQQKQNHLKKSPSNITY